MLQPEDEESWCVACGGRVRPETDRPFAINAEQDLCFGCSIERGGQYDEETDHWIRYASARSRGRPSGGAFVIRRSGRSAIREPRLVRGRRDMREARRNTRQALGLALLGMTVLMLLFAVIHWPLAGVLWWRLRQFSVPGWPCTEAGG